MPLYKIDHSRSRLWRYAVYRKSLGLWWTELNSDRIAVCEEYVKDAMKLPVYFDGPTA